MTPDLLWAFLTGLAGSLHCLGMCGALVVAYSLYLEPPQDGNTGALQASWSRGLAHHLLYNAGRVATYGLMGGLAAGFIQLGGLSDSPLPNLAITFTITGGLLMIFFGLVNLKVIRLNILSVAPENQKTSPLNRFIGDHLRSGRLASKWALGCAAGFLPCMLSWAMIVKAALTGNIAAGFLTMALFGLGTAPVLLFTGFFASVLTIRTRLAGERLAAVSVIIMGLVLCWKGALKLV